MTWLFSATIALSAFLLFWIQPLAAKLVLPLLGGTPGVWNTSMVFFQSVLVGGYVYAHLSRKFLSLRNQVLLHAAILVAAAVVLPIALPAGWEPSPSGSPAAWVAALLGITVGLPSLAISATAPLAQHWFSRGGHATSHNPYHLYAASNAGSIIALFGFPILIEPRLTLSLQGIAWGCVYALLAALLILCGVLTYRAAGRGAAGDPPGEEGPAGEPGVPRSARVRWLLLALVPSSLLLGVTTHITTDIASVPLLWVVPLGLYLLSFIMVFARRTILPHSWARTGQILTTFPLVVVFGLGLANSLVSFPLHLLAFFLAALVCHGELAACRPDARHLTEYYLWISVGGVLGGMFNVLAAPFLFPGIWEYPLALVLALALRPAPPDRKGPRPWFDLAVPAGLFAAVYGTLWALRRWTSIDAFVRAWPWVLGAGAVAALWLLRRRALGLALAAGCLIVAGLLMIESPGETLYRKRNFFGVMTVTRSQEIYNIFVHGHVVHGAQLTDPSLRREPLTYFSRQGPLGKVFAASKGDFFRRDVAVIGLGAGSIAAYGVPGQRITFYEIDPDVIEVARDDRYFTFLSDSEATVDTVPGDARLTLAKTPDASFDLIVIDAFSSDSIPVHIITREAFDLYARKLKPGGIIAANISNAYMDLSPILGMAARDMGWASLFQVHDPFTGDEQIRTNLMNSRWMVMARTMDDMGGIPYSGGWMRPKLPAGMRAWTDDYSNILSVLRLSQFRLKG
jgi:spermidine synthase